MLRLGPYFVQLCFFSWNWMKFSQKSSTTLREIKDEIGTHAHYSEIFRENDFITTIWIHIDIWLRLNLFRQNIRKNPKISFLKLHFCVKTRCAALIFSRDRVKLNDTMWKDEKFSLLTKIFSLNQLFSNLFFKTVTFTKFFAKNVWERENSRNFHATVYCETLLQKFFREND